MQGQGDAPTPVAPGLAADNPLPLGPARLGHCSLVDYGKFLGDQLRGARGAAGFLPAAAYRKPHQPGGSEGYAFGWAVAPRPWAGGDALTHAGSNTMNYAVVWMAPAKDRVLVAVTTGAVPRPPPRSMRSSRRSSRATSRPERHHRPQRVGATPMWGVVRAAKHASRRFVVRGFFCGLRRTFPL